jgi:hypothetical protein
MPPKGNTKYLKGLLRAECGQAVQFQILLSIAINNYIHLQHLLIMSKEPTPIRSEVVQKYYGTTDMEEVFAMRIRDLTGDPPPLDQWIKMKLPYNAPNHPKLPSLEEIESAWKDPAQRLTHPAGLRPVCRVGNCVIKFGRNELILQV